MKLLKFELLKLRKKSRGWLGPILVFVLIMTAFPLTVEMLNKDIGQSFLSVLWIATLLVMMLATEDIFLEDFNDGTLGADGNQTQFTFWCYCYEDICILVAHRLTNLIIRCLIWAWHHKFC